MRVRLTVLLFTFAGLAVPAAASAGCVHVVAPGESLTSIATADGLTVGQLAGANGLSPADALIAGTCLTIPPQGSGVAAPAGTAAGDGDADSDDPAAATTTVSTVSAPAPATSAGSYVVQPGDTLTAIAGRAGTSVSGLAAANRLNPLAPLLIGTVLQLSGSGASASAASSQPVGASAEGSSVSPPYPTPQVVSPSEVGSIAAANDVPPALAVAIADQESGFNNDLVSSADARGVMQILPGTWDWIQQSLVPGPPPLAPASATDNIRGGVLLLHSLLNATGGNTAMAAAGYFQGLPSVERNGLYPSTQQYVNDVMALEGRFGGGG